MLLAKTCQVSYVLINVDCSQGLSWSLQELASMSMRLLQKILTGSPGISIITTRWEMKWFQSELAMQVLNLKSV